MNKVKGVIFDMDGTLADNIPYHNKAWISLLKKYQVKKEESDIIHQIHGTNSEIIRRFFGNEISSDEIQLLAQEKETIYRGLYQPHIQEMDGLALFLHLLQKNNTIIGLATMSETENIDFLLHQLNVKNYFHSIVGGHEIDKGKPDPEVYHLALQKMKLNASDCIAVEDSLGGIRAAISAGIQVIGISSSLPREVLLENGCIKVSANYQELQQLWQAE